jgi:hypothetical protein
LHYVWLFVLFKILIPIYKIISHISNFFSDKSNHNKVYDNFFNKTMVKHNSKSQRWQQFKCGGSKSEQLTEI